MSIQFKFRSSVNFETLDIENRPSISVGELRAKILRGKFSQQQQGFDLVFSDAVSGLEYNGDDSQIPRGSSVIVKRVPGGTLPSSVPPVQVVKDIGREEFHHLCTLNGPEEEFDNLGADLCSIPDPNFPDFNLASDDDKLGGNEKDGITGLRLECEEIKSRNPNQAMLQGSNQSQNEMNNLPKADEQMELNKLPSPNFLDSQSSNLPLELKCPLCNTFFKEAVMIPCCQHSFCEKCIRKVLIEKGRCPQCFSNKCSLENLLPNLSLRQAIEHFLETQMINNVSGNAMQKYVPDGESGIQAQDASCAPTVVQREMELPQSSCATGKGSNQVFTEGFHGHHHGRNVPYANFDFQGENQTAVPQANALDEADSNTKRKGGIWVESTGGERNFSGFSGYRKGTRNCYTCGSPDHLMRDCPLSNRNPMFRPENGGFHGGMPGYAPPFWNGSSMPPFRPYANMYSNPAMMPFNASMVPVSHFASPYIQSMTGGLPGAGGNMRMGMGPPRATEHFGIQPCENKIKHSNENLGREQLSDKEDNSPECYHRSGPEKSLDYKLQKDKEPSLSHSGDSLARGLGRKSQSQHDKHMRSDDHYVDGRHDKGSHSSFPGRDKRPSHAERPERSNSGKDDLVRSSDRHSDGRHKHHHGESNKYPEKRGGHCGSESSLGHYSTPKEVKRRVESDVRSSHKKHHGFLESGLEPSSPNDRRGGHKERDTGHDSRHSRHSSKHPRDEQYDDRRRMISGPNDDSRDENRYHKRRAH